MLESMWRGLLLGTVGMLLFSWTFPATRVAIPGFGATVVGLGRAEIAAVCAAIYLIVMRERVPTRAQLISLAVTASGVVAGFPLFTALALESVPATHAAVVTGLLPAATAIIAVVRAHERPSLLFWIGSMGGFLAVLWFAYTQGAGSLQIADLYLLLAVLCGAVGYTEGGRLSREMSGAAVISWVVVIAAPFVAIPVAIAIHNAPPHPNLMQWIGLLYVGLVSMYLGFFAWYRGLAEGGIARVSQLQLAQPAITLVWSALFLGETISRVTALAAAAIIVCVGVCMRARFGGAPA